MTAPNVSHNDLKELGNKSFASGQFQDAALHYTYAIKKQPNVSVYYSNRALCYVQLNEYEKALADCKLAMDLDDTNLKAYFFAGQALLGLGQYDEALVKLLHAHELALEQHRNFGDDITSVIRLAKRKRFEATDEKRRQEEVALQAYLANLICEDSERQKQSILHSHGATLTCGIDIFTSSSTLSPSEAGHHGVATHDDATVLKAQAKDNTGEPTSLIVKAMVNEGQAESPTQPSLFANLPDSVKNQLQEITLTKQRRISELNELFAQVDERRRKREVPEYLCGRISFELMLDPVITPSGITYDRLPILTHLRQVGHFDPITRKSLVERQLIPNLAMKEVVHAFLDENPWAESF